MSWDHPDWKAAAREHVAAATKNTRPLTSGGEALRRPNGNAPLGSKLESICASEIKMTGIKWLWPDRFAIGKLGIIAGLPDEGKGLTLAFVTAQVTNAGPWPMNEGRSPQGNVIVFSDEDDANDTLVPRFRGCRRC